MTGEESCKGRGGWKADKYKS